MQKTCSFTSLVVTLSTWFHGHKKVTQHKLHPVLYQNGMISVMISSPSDSPVISDSGKVWLVEKFARGHPERGRFVSLGWVRTGDFCDFSTYKPPYLRNGARCHQSYYWTLIGCRISAFDWYQNQRPWMTVNWLWAVITRWFTLHICLSEPTTKIWMKQTHTISGKNVGQRSQFLAV